MSITDRCMVVNLQIGVWSGYKLDRDKSKEVTEASNAQADAARVNKLLVSKEVLRPIQTIASSARMHFHTSTLPWKDNGDRLLTRAGYMQFMQKHGELTEKFKSAASQFINADYCAARDQAAFRMGDLFKEPDYPDPEHLQQKFYINLDIDAVTEAGDFRVALDQDQLKAIRQDISQTMQVRLSNAMQDVWTRLANTLSHFTKKMDSDEKFQYTTVKNLEELAELLPALNILDDPDLDRIIRDVAQSLVGYKPDVLRKDKTIRAEVAGEAKRIMETMAPFMKAFGGGGDE